MYSPLFACTSSCTSKFLLLTGLLLTDSLHVRHALPSDLGTVSFGSKAARLSSPVFTAFAKRGLVCCRICRVLCACDIPENVTQIRMITIDYIVTFVGPLGNAFRF